MNKGFMKFAALCFLLVTVITLSPVNAQIDRERDPGYIFYKANAFYEDGKYDDAIKVYSGLIDQGLESGNLYYNMGNSYFKKGELGKAILNYERAKKLIPGDSDLKANYDFVLSKVRNVVSMETVTMHNRVMAIYNSFTINGLTILLSLLYTIVLLFVFIFFIAKSGVRYKTVFASFLLVFFLLTTYAVFNRISANDREAVLIAGSSDAMFEPVESATVHFSIYEGSKVYIVQEKGDWLKIRRQDGKIGWIKKADSEII